MAAQFEKDFQKHRKALTAPQTVMKPELDEIDLPDFVKKVHINDKVVPKDLECFSEEDESHCEDPLETTEKTVEQRNAQAQHGSNQFEVSSSSKTIQPFGKFASQSLVNSV